MIDSDIVRKQFPFLQDVLELRIQNPLDHQRLYFDSTASTHLPLPVLEHVAKSLFMYANVHRGEYTASQIMTEDLERAHNISANLVNAESWREICFGRNATEMINLVMRGIMHDFKDGDNLVVSRLEHNSNYVTWVGMQELLKRQGKNIDIRVVNFDNESGELDMNQFARFVDKKTKLVGVTGASNFMGYKPNLTKIAELAKSNKYAQPDGSKGAYFLIDGAQLVPGSHVDVQELGCDFLAWSFHKMAIPLGIGALYAKQSILEKMDPYVYGGDMVADVSEGSVVYKELPWRFHAGTPNILGTIASGCGINFLINLGLGNLYSKDNNNDNTEKTCEQIVADILMNTPRGDFKVPYSVPGESESLFGNYLDTAQGLEDTLHDKNLRLQAVQKNVRTAMTAISEYERDLTQRAIDGLLENKSIHIYGTHDAHERTALVAFEVQGMNYQSVANELNKRNIEVRHGPHCASLAHKALGIDGSVRMSFYVYNTPAEVDTIVKAVHEISRLA